MRLRTPQRRYVDPDTISGLPMRTESTPADLEVRERINDALDELPAIERYVFDRYYHERLTLVEIGAQIARSKSTVERYRNAAVRRLQSHLTSPEAVQNPPKEKVMNSYRVTYMYSVPLWVDVEAESRSDALSRAKTLEGCEPAEPTPDEWELDEIYVEAA